MTYGGITLYVLLNSIYSKYHCFKVLFKVFNNTLLTAGGITLYIRKQLSTTNMTVLTSGGIT
jgi:hypothetical protein